MRLKQAVVRSLIQQNATTLIGFTSGVVNARLVAPADFGAYSVAIAILIVTNVLRDFGVMSVVIGSRDLRPGQLGSAYALGLALSCVVTATLVAASWPLALIFKDPMVGEVLRIAAPSGLLSATVLPATVLLTRALRFDRLLVIGVTGALTQAAVSIALAWLGWGAAGLGWGFLAGAGASAVATCACAPSGSAVLPRGRGWRSLIRSGGLISATALVGSAAQQMPPLMIGRMLGLADAALFARAQNITSLILNSFFYAVMKPMLPGLAEAEREHGDLTPLYLRVVECVTGLSWPAYALLAVWGEPLIRVLYGPAWSPAGDMIPPIALAQSLQLAVAPHYDVLIVRGREGLLLLSESVVLAGTATALAAALRLGTAWPLWALPVGGLLFAAWYFFALKSVLGFRPAALAGVWARSLVLALPMLVVPLVVRHWAAPVGSAAILGCVGVSSLLAGLVWIAAIRMTGHQLGTLLPSPRMFGSRPPIFGVDAATRTLTKIEALIEASRHRLRPGRNASPPARGAGHGPKSS